MHRIRSRTDVAARLRQAGFTLVEMIISLALMGIVAMVMIPLLQMPMNGYIDAQRRSELQAQMDLIRVKLTNDLANALPGSVRVTQVGANSYLEFIEVKGVARYRTSNTGGPGYCTPACGATDKLSTSCAENCFTTLGPFNPYGTGTGAVVPQRGDYVAVLPSAGSISPPAYVTTNNSPTVLLTAVSPPQANGSVGLRFNGHTFQADDPNKRVYLLKWAVSYVCTAGTAANTGTLTKRWRYGMALNQTTVFGAAVNNATLSTRIAPGAAPGANPCRFYVSPTPGPALVAPQNLRQTVSLQINLATMSGAGVVTEQTQADMQFAVREP
ncbi:type II secretion system protein [Aquabacterium sp.]|uniref:type II secretion system protein n=1 Tax=Aquabacterium sp. TaxID=1872578 RepID=UPI0035B1280B